MFILRIIILTISKDPFFKQQVFREFFRMVFDSSAQVRQASSHSLGLEVWLEPPKKCPQKNTTFSEVWLEDLDFFHGDLKEYQAW